MTALALVHSPAEWAEKFGGAQAATQRGAVVSIGNFDGMHLGHQKILRAVVDRARQQQAVATVITFDPHPLKVLRPAQAPPLVSTLQQRLEGFASLGIEAALVLRFDMNLAARSPEEFVQEFLAGPLRAKEILVGGNFRFGHKQAGTAAVLQEMGARLGFSVEIIEPVVSNGEVVSSTAVRRAVSEGRAADAARLLGRPFALTGEIRRGEGRGRTILVPTLNLAPEQELLPKTGVYATETLVEGQARLPLGNQCRISPDVRWHRPQRRKPPFRFFRAAHGRTARSAFPGTPARREKVQRPRRTKEANRRRPGTSAPILPPARRGPNTAPQPA